jgi:hypothetical protein
MTGDMKTTLYVSCTQKADEADTMLFKSAVNWQCKDDVLHIITNNKIGLSKVYNKFLNEEIAKKHDRIVFVHDDVYIDDAMINVKLNEAMYGESKYDIVGLAGTRNPRIQHPALWHIMGEKQDHRGYAGHIFDKHKVMTGFGPTPDRVAIVDGLFVAVNVARALETNWRWNENFDFHHYDIASCIDANVKGMRIGVWPINVFHESPGLRSLDDAQWSKSNQKFLQIYS